jgi:thiosulfate reductase cytochrome b subunit
MPDAASPPIRTAPRHGAVVRITHWIMTLAFFALLLSGVEILISHPRFYWGETGHSLTPALFQIPIPSSRDTVDTGYDYVLPDQNGWSRYLHFEAAWAVVLAGLVYALASLWNGHFRKDLLQPSNAEAHYNPTQRAAYLAVIFALFPLMILTGLAMSPGFNSALPFVVTAFGGRQSARTLHFFFTLSLVLFLIGHVTMIIRTGFSSLMKAMLTGTAPPTSTERP